MQLEYIVPALMACALIWWIGRSLSWIAKLTTAVVTLVIILLIVGFERHAF